MSRNLLNNEEGMGPIETGRSRYQRKNFTGALEAFTEAVEMSTGHMLFAALDYRAATYEKLEKLQPALRDAKGMIDLKPELSKGYLRCAKVLQLKGEHNLALKIYERGLKKVKIGNDNDRVVLQAQFAKLQKLQVPAKNRDPLSYLPLELAEIVIKNLAMRDRIICLAVSKPWKRLLESSHKLWTNLDTSSTKRSISKASLKAYIKRSNYTVDQAKISMTAKLDVVKMQYLTQSCKNLRQLEFCGRSILGESLTLSIPFAKKLEIIRASPSCEITSRSVENVMQTIRKTAVEAEFLGVTPSMPSLFWPYLEHLKVLRLRVHGNRVTIINRFHLAKALAYRIYADLSQPALLIVIPNIEILSIEDWKLNLPIQFDLSHLKRLSQLELVNVDLRSIPLLPPTIKHLNVNNNSFLSASTEDEFVFPLLETFNCEGTNLNSRAIKAITSHSIDAGNLKRLFLGDMAMGSPIPGDLDCPRSDTVEELSLARLQISEKKLLEILGKYPNVRRADLSCTRITGVGVKQLVSAGVEWLVLNECSDLGPDAVEYARGKGVNVLFNFPSRQGGSRGFRDLSFATGF